MLAPNLSNRNVSPLFVPKNWRDANNYILPTAAVPMRPIAMYNFERKQRPPSFLSNWRDRHDPNERAPHNWSHHSNRANTTLLTQRDRNVIDGAWIQTAHKYTIAFESVCHCLLIHSRKMNPNS